jgi:hypothetical protein
VPKQLDSKLHGILSNFALDLAVETYRIVFGQIYDRNILPFLHVTLASKYNILKACAKRSRDEPDDA